MLKNITIAVLLISMTLIIMLFLNMKSNLLSKYEIHFTKMQNKYETLVNLEYKEFMDVGKKILLPDDLELSRKLERSRLNSIVCFRIPNSYCTTCIDEYLDQFATMVKNIGENNALVLVNYEDENTLEYLMKRHSKLAPIIFHVKNLYLDIESEKAPYILFINEAEKIINVHLTNKSFTDRTNMYIEALEFKYKNES